MKEAERNVETRLAWFDYAIFADENLREIIKLARQDWDDDATVREIRRQNRPRGARPEEYRPEDHLLAVDFLRHQRSSYDWQLGQIQEALSELEPVDEDGENPLEAFFDDLKNRAHEIIRSKTHEVIRARFPSLAGAIAKR